MSLNAVVRLPLSSSRTLEDGLVRHSLFSSNRTTQKQRPERRQRQRLVVQAKGKKGMQARQFQRPPPPPMPKIEDDGNPRFVIFIRMAYVMFAPFCPIQIWVFLFFSSSLIFQLKRIHFFFSFMDEPTDQLKHRISLPKWEFQLM